ncbi:acetamidase [Vibrio nigripulchritudo]|uniref:acetamidase/formamidase family protein n=1 Tax=Vibrio nigripulchritudo TaxID=28173 RepID=UPI00190C0C6E|nr:acetamidase/formamidase family protein [Vibrio nigripulchritudo]BCL73186.1 acetamidase [Vibrio nigripulchritudo]BDU34550.1 acetamidase [Vibrio nigripulchritudo]
MCNNLLIKTIHSVHHHHGWNNAIEPAFRVGRGTTLEFECLDSSGGQLTRASTVGDIAGLDFGKINPVTGPIYVEGAKPGDVLKLTIHEFKPSGFGWTANIPGFGLLADQFEAPALNLWSYDSATLAPAAFSTMAKVPLKPFAGTIGVAPAASGDHSVVPPRRIGGNMDIRDLSAGTTLYIPIEVEGALLSIGDTHAAQGDGEVCGTAIESPMNVVVELDVVDNLKIQTPYFTTTGPVTRHLDSKGYQVTTGVEPDLMAGARSAVSQMIDLLCAQHHMSPEEAYMLCSVCGDLRISEIVDIPNWLVSFYMPNVVFE